MTQSTDHSLRSSLSQELHARPFAALSAPGSTAYLAFLPENTTRDKDAEYRHLAALLSHYNVPAPPKCITHWSGQIGKHYLKWESHSEFVSFTLFGEGETQTWFDPGTFAAFPDDWLADSPGALIASVVVQVTVRPVDDGISQEAATWLHRDSLAISRMLDDSLVVASDFQIDSSGHTRFVVFARPQTDRHRIGRVVQRLCEVETYKTLAMLGFVQARDLAPDIYRLEQTLTDLVSRLGSSTISPADTLHELLSVSGTLEHLIARASYRFSATRAYNAIVTQRIQILREQRFEGKQTFGEFMMRRYEPSIRTAQSTEARLMALIERAGRAADLLRTRVDVERSEASQGLLSSMNQRADTQLRLQQTVEGLSVVAISYYALNLALYLCAPLAEYWHIAKSWLGAACTLPVVLVVWFLIRRIRRKFH